MKAKIIFQEDTFVGEVVSWRIQCNGHAVNLEQVRRARLGARCKNGYVLLKDGTCLTVFRHGLFGTTPTIRGEITLRVTSLGEEICFDVQEIDDSFVPAESSRFGIDP